MTGVVDRDGNDSAFGKQVPSWYRRLDGSLNGLRDVAFRSTWDTSNTSTGSSTSTQIKLPLVSTGSYNFTVDWGDGSSDEITAWNQAEVTHTYASADVYNVVITGQCKGWQFNNGGDKLKLTGVSNWGTLNPVVEGAFYGCSNLVVTAGDTLDTSGMTSFRNFFRNTQYNQPANNWVTTGVTDMGHVFRDTPFNQPIGDWDVSSVITFESMFQNTPFDQDIGSWDVSSCQTFDSMFQSADFNQDIGSWDVSSGNTFDFMFFSTPFNQDIDSWNMSGASDIRGIFSNSAMNTSVDSWDVSSVVSMRNAFNSTPYNQALNSWRPSSCTDFVGTFQNASFNQPIGSWTLRTTGSINMFNMFRGSSFNQDISSWDTQAVTAMNFMFYLNTAFNQDIGSWDVSSVTTFDSMFRNTNFDQDISGWDIQSLTDASDMFLSGAQSTANYDALLIGWEANVHNNNVPFTTNAQYTTGGAAETARNALIADGWTIVDGGGV